MTLNFLEWIARGSPVPGDANYHYPLEESIRDNLRRVLGSRRGMAPAAMDYGMPELDRVVDHRSHIPKALAAAVKQTIEQYEPRISDVNVGPVPSSGTDSRLVMHLAIKATITTSTGARIRFVASVNANGGVDVRRKA